MPKFTTIDEYVGHLPEASRNVAQAVRATIHGAAELVEAIRYDMPAFRSGNATVIYFAVWKRHVGLYPIYRGSDAFEARIAPFRAKTDTVQIPLDRPLPHDLIAEIVRSQMARLAGRTAP
ncbi:iron chaperone [Wenxinia marina]|uniref:YdhG-like domain-containing protein n=1 Tax=Wenxinia marina DSM 24838 TaxID=1123501 RepID=A0A0D0PYM3_9RHOB|nr:DUF1801 domain-containing protein [Wenxinia marina]KIQ67534.1 hypothetical protein Wenmar_03959 [Wenxinia marina DSM 24838]GGL68706.1 hypothetical protein GCM10011392_23990 [Wenxinia marina]